MKKKKKYQLFRQAQDMIMIFLHCTDRENNVFTLHTQYNFANTHVKIRTEEKYLY